MPSEICPPSPLVVAAASPTSLTASGPSSTVLAPSPAMLSNVLDPPPATCAPSPAILVLPSPSSKASSNASSKTSSGSPPPPYLASPSLRDILAALQVAEPTSNYIGLLEPLNEAGIHSLGDVALQGEQDILQWTGLPLFKLKALCDYARRWDAMGHLGVQPPVEANENYDDENEEEEEPLDLDDASDDDSYVASSVEC